MKINNLYYYNQILYWKIREYILKLGLFILNVNFFSFEGSFSKHAKKVNRDFPFGLESSIY